ncbi:MAG: isochorismate synthase [Pseudomonadota bacterium]
MFKPHILLANIRQRLEVELERHPPRNNRYYTLNLKIEGFHFNNLSCAGQRWCYWSKPDNEEYRLGAGEVLRFSTTGAERFKQLSATYRETLKHWDRYDPDASNVEPVLFTGFAFSADAPMSGAWQGLPNSGLCLPEVLLQQLGDSCTLSCSCHPTQAEDALASVDSWISLLTQIFDDMLQRPGPPGHRTNLPLTHREPTSDVWLEKVRAAIRAIDQGLLEKVVLSRHIHVRAERKLNPIRLMSTLNCLYPDSVLFATRQDGLTFLAATPEYLLTCKNSLITSDAVAGTLPRAADETRDRQLGQKLLNDPKSQHEHQVVVDNILAVMDEICSAVEPVKQPQLKRLRVLQHLWTLLRGTLKPGIGLFEAAEQLHPTAAVNGMPVQRAHAWLDENEPFSRGWYTGAAGWINPKGDGELAVLIRCVQLKGYDAELYAGAGITADSDPESEYAETELKLAAMLEAMEDA